MNALGEEAGTAGQPEAVILCGIQLCGKTTFYAERFLHTHVRLTLELAGTRERETLLLQSCLDAGTSFVVDKVNASAAERARYIRPAREAGFRVRAFYFPTSPRVALERNGARDVAERIPADAILAAANCVETPTVGEGIDELFYVNCVDGRFQADAVATVPRFAARLPMRLPQRAPVGA